MPPRNALDEPEMVQVKRPAAVICSESPWTGVRPRDFILATQNQHQHR